MWYNDHRLQLALTGVGSAAIAALTTYAVSAKRLEAKYATLAESEIAEVKRYYATIKTPSKPSLDGLASRAQAELIINDQGYQVPDPPLQQDPETGTLVDEGGENTETIDDEEQRNIFENFDVENYFDPEEEARRRVNEPNKPYILTIDEFNQGERDFNQVTLTYYEGDEVLCDERDQMVDDKEGTVGTDNLLRFGHASNDRNVVYVRNERLSIDIEVLRSEGDYAKEVLGFIQHEDKPGVRRFRNHWD